eukprot:GHVS01009737.1.p1 GENE.GHVS01009737.1~~GHVS01009737.1.p1  ORF type:complete len:212 (+),score=31.70 GHVS01009737.1:299-934(+)
MYYVVEGARDVSVAPRFLGPKYEEKIEDTLRSQIEGHCTEDLGYVVCVLKVLGKDKGRVQDGTGLILVRVKYQAIVFMPHKGMVLDGVVTDVNELGFFVQCGPVKAFVSAGGMPASFSYQRNATVPCWSESRQEAEEEDMMGGGAAGNVGVIKPQSEVRLRLQGVRYDNVQMYAIATIDGDFLGPAESMEEEAGRAKGEDEGIGALQDIQD